MAKPTGATDTPETISSMGYGEPWCILVHPSVEMDVSYDWAPEHPDDEHGDYCESGSMFRVAAVHQPADGGLRDVQLWTALKTRYWHGPAIDRQAYLADRDAHIALGFVESGWATDGSYKETTTTYRLTHGAARSLARHLERLADHDDGALTYPNRRMDDTDTRAVLTVVEQLRARGGRA